MVEDSSRLVHSLGLPDAPVFGVDGAAPRFPARMCSVTVAHAVIVCAVAEGAGVNLGWSLTVGNQTSQSPVTGYRYARALRF